MNKPLTIKGNSNSKPILAVDDEKIILVSSSNVKISNLKLESTKYTSPGMQLSSSYENIIIENVTFNSYRGILIYNHNVTISDCNFSCVESSIKYDPKLENNNLLVTGNHFSGEKEYSSTPQIILLSGKDINIINNYFEKIDRPIDCTHNIENIFIKDNIFFKNNATIKFGTMGLNIMNITLDNNQFLNNYKRTMFSYSENLHIMNNYFYNNSEEFLISNTNNIDIHDNYFLYNQDNCMKLEDSDDIDIFDNKFENNHAGLVIDQCTGKSIWNNEFNNNEIQASDSSVGSGWNKNYPTGGNFWSDYTGQDKKKGSQQDITGSDGFGDISYFNGNVRDNYPIFLDSIAPNANTGPDMKIDLGDVYHFDATDSTDDQMVTDFEWSFQYNGEEVVRDIAEFDFQFDIAGVYDCELTVADFAGNSDTDTITITVEDSSPPVLLHKGILPSIRENLHISRLWVQPIFLRSLNTNGPSSMRVKKKC